MPLPWIKMWLEALDDPKLTRLSLAERGAWWGILELAGKCDAGGKILSGSVGLDMDEIADALHIKTTEDRQALESMIAQMEKRGSLRWNESVLIVGHWEERQRIPPSSRPESVAKRVRDHRERKKEHEPVDPMVGERLALRGIEYKNRRKELGRDLTTEEWLELVAGIDQRLEAKYGRKFEDSDED